MKLKAVRVQLVLGDGAQLASLLTRESAELLSLHKGQPVLALCKATAVQMGAQAQPSHDTHNLLQGVVSRGAPANRGGELSLALPGGLHLVGMAAPGQGLPRSSPAWAWFEASAVVLALPS